MSEGLLKITEDKKIKEFIDTFGGLLDLVKGVGTVAGWTAKASGSVGGAAGSVSGFCKAGTSGNKLKDFTGKARTIYRAVARVWPLCPLGGVRLMPRGRAIARTQTI